VGASPTVFTSQKREFILILVPQCFFNHKRSLLSLVTAATQILQTVFMPINRVLHIFRRVCLFFSRTGEWVCQGHICKVNLFSSWITWCVKPESLKICRMLAGWLTGGPSSVLERYASLWLVSCVLDLDQAVPHPLVRALLPLLDRKSQTLRFQVFFFSRGIVKRDPCCSNEFVSIQDPMFPGCRLPI
jgi:hypothetical protein